METTATTAKSAPIAIEKAPRDWLRWVSIALAAIGTFIAGYIVYTDILQVEVACPATGAFNCSLVQHSIYSKLGPIPVAYLGLGGYLLILAVLLLETRVPFLADRGKAIVFGLTLFGVLFSGYLTAVEAFILHYWCIWCLGSAITMALLFIVSFMRLWREMTAFVEEDEAAT
jgi:uncharacterized membrane protein